MSGWLGVFIGRNRMGPLETTQNKMKSLLITTGTGLIQMFTITFFLVGWFWGIAWGIMLISISSKLCTIIR